MKNIPQTFLSISEIAMFTHDEQRIVSTILSKEKLQLTDFKIEEETGNFFKTRPRQVLLIPDDFTVSKLERDDLNSKGNMLRYKIQVSFSLPKGSYATIVTKRLFGH